MCEVKAIIRPQRLDHVMQGLHAIPGLPAATVSTVRANSDSQRLEGQTATAAAEAVVTAVGQASHTGRAGDGIVYVVPVQQFIRISALPSSGSMAQRLNARSRSS